MTSCLQGEIELAREQLSAQWSADESPPIELVRSIAEGVLERRHDQESLELNASQMIIRARAIESALVPIRKSHRAALASVKGADEKRKMKHEHEKELEGE